jgi:hypothetical protein
MKPQSPCRVVAGLVALVALAVLAPACGTASAGPPAAAAAGDASAVGYAQCMRSHGVPEYPDPNSSGELPKITPANETQLGVSDSRFNAAASACQDLWPYQEPPPAFQRQELTDALKFARCMRSHGVPNWPDPSTDPDSGRVRFVISVSEDGFVPQSPPILAKARQCERGVPADMLPGSPDGVAVTTSP